MSLVKTTPERLRATGPVVAPAVYVTVRAPEGRNPAAAKPLQITRCGFPIGMLQVRPVIVLLVAVKVTFAGVASNVKSRPAVLFDVKLTTNV